MPINMRSRMTIMIVAGIIIGIILIGFVLTQWSSTETFITLSTTTSIENSGLMDVILPSFKDKYHIRVDLIPVGTGQALEIARRGDVDGVIVHAPDLELEFVKEGFGIHRLPFMYNYFLIVGPKEDPANIKGSENVTDAFIKIFSTRSKFISRGDNSGTHVREQKIWNSTKLGLNVTDEQWLRQNEEWYVQTGTGMSSTLRVANEMKGYTITDSGTWLFLKESLPNLEVMVNRSYPLLYNLYSAIMVNPSKYPSVKFDLVKQFYLWLISDEGQSAIAAYEINGYQAFTPCFPECANLTAEEAAFWGLTSVF